MNSAKHWFNAVERLTGLFSQITAAIGAVSAGGSRSEGARLDVLISKVTRAKAVVEKLQLLHNREAALKHQYGPLLQRARDLEQQLSAHKVHRMARFAESEGLQPVLAKLRGEDVSTAALSDPFGVLMALSPSNPNAPMGWAAYLAALRTLQHTTEVLDSPSLEQLQAFSRQRHLLLAEMHSLQRQLEGQVELPPLDPLDIRLQSLEEFVTRVGTAQRLHFHMLQRDLGKLQLGMLEIKLKINMGEGYSGSPEETVVTSMKPVCSGVLEHGRLPSVQAMEQFYTNLQQLAVLLQARRGGTQSKATLSTLADRAMTASH